MAQARDPLLQPSVLQQRPADLSGPVESGARHLLAAHVPLKAHPLPRGGEMGHERELRCKTGQCGRD